ncbi:expressed unknown protein [Seminavis robusta]|uniref:Uncharacterized protein n=1 Tax=Seminavis robusta TaxID=568900 RepID=A0A9N8E4A2_9STRA|nr:expressed unknown protein [Seminavis robusta]|eukprot:Sro650_g037021.1  (123) ;mRNA; f:1063-1431
MDGSDYVVVDGVGDLVGDAVTFSSTGLVAMVVAVVILVDSKNDSSLTLQSNSSMLLKFHQNVHRFHQSQSNNSIEKHFHGSDYPDCSSSFRFCLFDVREIAGRRLCQRKDAASWLVLRSNWC